MLCRRDVECQEKGAKSIKKTLLLGNISISMMEKVSGEFQERSGWVLRKPFEGGAGTVPLHRRGERSLKPSRL